MSANEDPATERNKLAAELKLDLTQARRVDELGTDIEVMTNDVAPDSHAVLYLDPVQPKHNKNQSLKTIVSVGSSRKSPNPQDHGPPCQRGR